MRYLHIYVVVARHYSQSFIVVTSHNSARWRELCHLRVVVMQSYRLRDLYRKKAKDAVGRTWDA